MEHKLQYILRLLFVILLNVCVIGIMCHVFFGIRNLGAAMASARQEQVEKTVEQAVGQPPIPERLYFPFL